MHPGLNLLGRYFPPSKVNSLLLADLSRMHPSSPQKDVFMPAADDRDLQEDLSVFDIMDLASFIECALFTVLIAFFLDESTDLQYKPRIVWNSSTSE